MAYTSIIMALMKVTSQGTSFFQSGVEVAELLPLIVNGFKQASAFKTTLWKGFEIASTTTRAV